jgi:hypothetical protein
MSARIKGAPPLSLAETYKSILYHGPDNPNHDVVTLQLALPWKVASCLRNHEVGDALQHIVDVLRQVCHAMFSLSINDLNVMYCLPYRPT